MTKDEILDKYGHIPNDIKILEILLKTELKTIGKIKVKDVIIDKGKDGKER